MGANSARKGWDYRRRASLALAAAAAFFAIACPPQVASAQNAPGTTFPPLVPRVNPPTLPRPPNLPPNLPPNPAAPRAQPPPTPLPDWYTAAMQTVEDAAAEFERDSTSLQALWQQKSAALAANVSSAVAAAGVRPDEWGGRYTGQAANLLGNFAQMPQSLRYEKTVLGRYGRADRSALGGDRQWTQGTLDGLAADLAAWRTCRAGAEQAIIDYFAVFESEESASVVHDVMRNRQSKHGDTGDIESAQIAEAAEAAESGWRGRDVRMKVARARLTRLAACYSDHLFVFYHVNPIGLVARIDQGRVPWAEGMARLSTAMKRLEEAELSWAQRSTDADTGIYGDLGEGLAAADDQIANWANQWRFALDFPTAELDRIDKVVADAVKTVADFEAQAAEVSKGSKRWHELSRAEREDQMQLRALDAKADQLDAAGDRAGATADREAGRAYSEKAGAAYSEERTIETAAAPIRTTISELQYKHWLELPAPDTLVALVAVPSNELDVVKRLEDSPGVTSPTRGLLASDPFVIRLALGIPFWIEPVHIGVNAPSYARLSLTLEAGAGSVTTELERGSNEAWAEKMAHRVALVTAAGERILAAPPPAAPPPSEIEPPLPRPHQPNEPGSPIAGKWNVTYLDGALGWVTGEAELDPYGDTATIKLTDPKTRKVYTVIADEVKHEADGSYTLELRGQQPHLDGRLATAPRNGTGGNTEIEWVLEGPKGTHQRATPTLPPEVIRLVAADNTTEIHATVGTEKATFKIPAAEPAKPGPLKLHLHPMDTKRGQIYSEAFGIVTLGFSADESLQGIWEEPVDPSTRQPPNAVSRYRLLERDADNPNRVRQVGVEIWWRKEAAKIEILALTVAGPIKVTRFFHGVPTVIEAVFDDPQRDQTKEITVTLDGNDLKFTAKRDPQDYRRFTTDVILPGAPGTTASGAQR